MKFVFVLIALVCANLYFCQAYAVKPSGHLESTYRRGERTYSAGQVIKDWSVSSTHSHLAGEMSYSDGRLTVPTAGRYFIYAQLYYHNRGRIFVLVDGYRVTMIQPVISNRDMQGSLNAIGVFKLNAGDRIYLKAGPSNSGRGPVKIYMSGYHSYFGAFMI